MSLRIAHCCLLIGWLGSFVAGMHALPAAAADGVALLMVEQEDCPYCARFNREIATAYPNTTEGRLAPLIRIHLENPWPQEFAAIRRETLTPTFILVADGVEIDRLHGYQGDEFFWFLLGEMLARLPEGSNHTDSSDRVTPQD